MLQVNQSEPLYWQLFARLRQDIEYGALAPGEYLPSERKLAAYHGISRLTARKALQLLIQQGYARAEQGKGTYVISPFPNTTQPCLKSFVGYLQQMGMTTSSRLICRDTVPARHCPADLPCDADEKLIHIQKVYLSDSVPLALVTGYWRYADFRPLLTVDVTQTPFHILMIQVLENADLRVQQTVRAALADETTAHLLEVKPLAVLLQLQRIFYNAHNQFLCYAQALYRGDSCYLDFT
ncbi:MAG: GntR family transcriptional regulator [Anaerolineae bacterium]|nr:GntR family transcriptional regulator [Anaerolineae bacterium]